MVTGFTVVIAQAGLHGTPHHLLVDDFQLAEDLLSSIWKMNFYRTFGSHIMAKRAQLFDAVRPTWFVSNRYYSIYE